MRRASGPMTGLPVDRLKLRGGRLCLDFINTVDPRWGEESIDYLDSYAALAGWVVHAGALTLDQFEALRGEAVARPAEADATLRRAIALREALYRTLMAVGHDDRPAMADLEIVNAEFREAMARGRLAPDGGGFTVAWAEDARRLDRPLWPVMRSAAELLTSPDLARVRTCSSDGCGWVFLDETKNRGRRWCSMEVCGSREKARAYYRRRRAAQPS